jgi:hypothetical protein
MRQVDNDEGGSFAALQSDKTAWQRRHRMLQLGRDGLGCYSLAEMASDVNAGGDGLGCDSLAEMASDVTAWQRWPRM